MFNDFEVKAIINSLREYNVISLVQHKDLTSFFYIIFKYDGVAFFLSVPYKAPTLIDGGKFLYMRMSVKDFVDQCSHTINTEFNDASYAEKYHKYKYTNDYLSMSKFLISNLTRIFFLLEIINHDKKLSHKKERLIGSTNRLNNILKKGKEPAEAIELLLEEMDFDLFGLFNV